MPRLEVFGQKAKHIKNFCSKIDREIGHSGKFTLHEIRTKVRVAADHFFATVTDPLLDYFYWRSSHDQSAYSVVPKTVHPTKF